MPVVIAATATANRLIWAIVFKLVTDSEYANNDFDHIGARYHFIKL